MFRFEKIVQAKWIDQHKQHLYLRKVGRLQKKTNQNPSTELSGPTTDSSAPSNSFGLLKNALLERGQKISQLEQKFGDMEERSKDFLQSAKALGERQAQKKWWQF
jgi:hypothetical protein